MYTDRSGALAWVCGSIGAGQGPASRFGNFLMHNPERTGADVPPAAGGGSQDRNAASECADAIKRECLSTSVGNTDRMAHPLGSFDKSHSRKRPLVGGPGTLTITQTYMHTMFFKRQWWCQERKITGTQNIM